MTVLKLIFAGTPEFAAQQLQAIVTQGQHQVIAVYSQADQPKGRGKKLQATPVKALAEQLHIPVFQPTSLKSAQAQQQLAELNADLMVVVAYGMILPTEVLNLPRLGCLNIHASLLPRWRGAAPIERSIEAGDAVTGITLMQMDAGLDTGPMLHKSSVTIEPHFSGDELRDALSRASQLSLGPVLDQLARLSSLEHIETEPQDNAQACYAHKLSKQEALIDWQLDGQTLVNKIRAFCSSNVTYTFLQQQRIKVWQATLAPNDTADAGTNITSGHIISPGHIVSSDSKGIRVQCGRGQIDLQRLQLPGAKVLAVRDLLNSKAALFQAGGVFEVSGV